MVRAGGLAPVKDAISYHAAKDWTGEHHADPAGRRIAAYLEVWGRETDVCNAPDDRSGIIRTRSVLYGSALLDGGAASRTEERMLTEQRKVHKRSSGRSRSSWWLVAKNDNGPFEVLTVDGGYTLPVFSGEGEAELFSWLREVPEHGWEVHQVSVEELASVLWGRCLGVGFVALDPSIGIFDGEDAELPGLSREDFLDWIVPRSL